jgi:hypothetical protein
VLADAGSAQHRGVGGDPGVSADDHGLGALRGVGVQVVLVRIEDPRAGTHEHAPPQLERPLGAQMAAVQEALRPDLELRPRPRGQHDRTQVRAQPGSRPDLDVGSRFGPDPQGIGPALRHDPGPDAHARSGLEMEVRDRQVGAGLGVDLEAGVTRRSPV